MERSGMGREVAARWPDADALYRQAGGGRSGLPLHGTETVQPALTAVALGAAAVLTSEGLAPDVVAGHSVGELAAWAIAGGLRPHEAVSLAATRGSAMAAAATACPGGMWAFAPDAMPSPRPDGFVIAVYNPGQTLLSGPGLLPGGARVQTSGAWHSPAMMQAIPIFSESLLGLPPRAMHTAMVSNHDGTLVEDWHTVRDHLLAQLCAPVRWTSVLRTLGGHGVTDAVLLGPGKILAAQLRVALPEVRVHRTDGARHLEATVRALGQAPS